MSGKGNRVLECLGGLLKNCAEVALHKAELEQVGLILPGLPQQIDFAMQYLTDGDKTRDLYMIHAGANDYLGPGVPGHSADDVVQNLANALTRVYEELGARYIVMSNVLEPCSTPMCDRLHLGVRPFPPQRIAAVKAYSPVWTGTIDEQLRQVVDEFNSEHPDATVIFVDVYGKMTEVLGTGELVTQLSCQEAMTYYGATIPGPDKNGYYDCSGYAWTDYMHPTSNVWERVAKEEFIPAIQGAIPPGILSNMRRLITFGDSLTDLGSMKDTVDRANAEWGATYNTAPASGLMAQDGPSLVQYIEDGLGFFNSVPFIQPSSKAVNEGDSQGGGE